MAFLVKASSSASDPDERGDVGAAELVGVGGLLHQLMGTAMHGAVVMGQEVSLRVEDL